jgi:hypothetical protein
VLDILPFAGSARHPRFHPRNLWFNRFWGKSTGNRGFVSLKNFGNLTLKMAHEKKNVDLPFKKSRIFP